jgi:hypothetical protein
LNNGGCFVVPHRFGLVTHSSLIHNLYPSGSPTSLEDLGSILHPVPFAPEPGLNSNSRVFDALFKQLESERHL